MILAQFQSLYPSGSLITELVKIDHGQYIVRATVQIEGAIRSTGMAAATTVEEAEDRARDRALMVLGMPAASSTPTTSSSTDKIETPQQSVVAPMESNISPVPATDSLPTTDSTQTPEVPATQSHNLDLQIPAPPQTARETSTPEMESQPVANMDISATNIKPFPQRSSSKSGDINTEKPPKKRKKSEPVVDQSDDIAKISVEMQRLNWTMEQGRDYLIRTYNKRSRHLLSQEELKDFLEYLESQPTPIDPLSDIDPLAGF